MERIEYELYITVKTPFLFPGLAGMAFGLDAACLRNEQKELVIPADQICGIIRERLRELADLGGGLTKDHIETLFGKESPKNKEDEIEDFNIPQRALVYFSDATASCYKKSDDETEKLIPEESKETVRIQIDEKTGAVKRGHLLVIEQPLEPGAFVKFTGKVTAYIKENKQKVFEDSVKTALQSLQAVGSYKSSGFGEVCTQGTDFVFKKSDILSLPPSKDTADGKITYEVFFDSPILVNAELLGQNAFKGSEIIPGGVFKGALARKLEMINNNEDYSETLSELSFSHALPTREGGKPQDKYPLPLSLVCSKTKDNNEIKICDALLKSAFEENDNSKGVLIDGTTAVFQGDWKGSAFSAALTELGISKTAPLKQIIRTHSAINDPEKPINDTGVVEDGKIFTTIACSTRYYEEDKVGEQRPWVLDIDASQVKNKKKAATLLKFLEGGLDGIGKTSAQARFNLKSKKSDDNSLISPISGTTDQYALVILTDAVLTKPDEERSARVAYEEYWKEVFQGSDVVFKNFYAAQKYAGGYQATRYRPYGDTYHPFILTCPGSVFLLEGNIKDRLEELCKTGLPVPKSLNASWKNCPFMPENGYARFRADYLSDSWGAKILNKEGLSYE